VVIVLPLIQTSVSFITRPKDKTLLLTALFAAASALGAGGCAVKPGQTTAIGAGTGGAIGAGLGAIVGAQSGDPGSGLAIGLAAGSATGAMVGNAVEAQDVDIKHQSEIIRNQDTALMSQRAELERLRRELGDDAGSQGGGFGEGSAFGGAGGAPVEVDYPVTESAPEKGQNIEGFGGVKEVGSNNQFGAVNPDSGKGSNTGIARGRADFSNEFAKDSLAGKNQSSSEKSDSEDRAFGRAYDSNSASNPTMTKASIRSNLAIEQLDQEDKLKNDDLEGSRLEAGEANGTVFISKKQQAKQAVNTISDPSNASPSLSASHPSNRFAKYRGTAPAGTTTATSAGAANILPNVNNNGTLKSSSAPQSKSAPIQEDYQDKNSKEFHRKGSFLITRGREGLETNDNKKRLQDAKNNIGEKSDGSVGSIATPSEIASTQRIKPAKIQKTKAITKPSEPEKVLKEVQKVEKSTQIIEEKTNKVAEGAIVNDTTKACEEADSELVKARARVLPEDKLFHLRRALRLCPEEGRLHLEIATLYRSLARDGDAVFEYHEALRLDPKNKESSDALKELGSSGE
jgi:tetratricopeptide (TPR) repeat protein